jgi:hypothetical protein
VLTKDSAYFNLPKPASDAYYYQHNLHFMGWVSKEGSAP